MSHTIFLRLAPLLLALGLALAPRIGVATETPTAAPSVRAVAGDGSTADRIPGASPAAPADGSTADRIPGASPADPAEAPRSADAWLNRGLEHARADRIADALLAFENALRLAPLDTVVRDARDIAVEEIRRRRADRKDLPAFVAGEPDAVVWWRIFGALPPTAVAIVLILLAWAAAAAGLLAARRPASAFREILRVLRTVLALAAVVAAGWWLGYLATARTVRPAIVLDGEAVVREAPDPLAAAIRPGSFYLGATVRMGAVRDGWVELELSDETRVWAPIEAVGPISP